MIKNRRRRLRYQGSSRTTQVMSLSLFIMLLAFFIVLNARSVYEPQKKDSVIQSLEHSFAVRSVIRQDVGPTMVQDRYQSIRDGQTRERISALFQAQILGVSAAPQKGDGVLMLTMPLESFSRAILAAGQEDLLQTPTPSLRGTFFTPTLVSLLASDSIGIRYRMDVFMMVDQDPIIVMRERPQEMIAMRQRLASWAQTLHEAGMPPKLFSVGLKDGQADTVEIIFRPYQPFSPIGEGQTDVTGGGAAP